MNDSLRTGVLGLGAMGGPMAANLAAKGLLTAVWNRTRAVAETLSVELGVPAADTPAELAAACDVVLVCVSADRDLLEVIDATLPGLAAGSMVVDTSTVSPATAVEVRDRLAGQGVGFVDAPVSGGVEGAVNGTLSVMAGGESADISRIRPVLDAISARVTHMGPVGAGQATKAVNQVIVGGIAEAVCEALALAKKLNLPSERLLPVLGAGAAGSWFLDHRGHSMMEGRFDKGFKPELLLKDLRNVREMARELDISMTTTDLAIREFGQLVRSGDGENDTSSLIKLKLDPAKYKD